MTSYCNYAILYDVIIYKYIIILLHNICKLLIFMKIGHFQEKCPIFNVPHISSFPIFSHVQKPHIKCSQSPMLRNNQVI